MSDLREVIGDFVRFAGVNELAACENNELVEEGDDVATRLVNGEDNGTVVIARERNETVDDAQSVVRVET